MVPGGGERSSSKQQQHEKMMITDRETQRVSAESLTGSALGPKVQVQVQVPHHVAELVVVGVFSQLEADRDRLVTAWWL